MTAAAGGPAGTRTGAGTHLKGTLIALAGIVVLSPDAAIVHLLDLDPATMVFWRGIGVGCVMAVAALAVDGRRAVAVALATGWTGLALVAALALCQIGWVTALAFTDPSHVLVLVATAPLFGALVSRALLGERVRPATAVAMACALVAVAVVASSGLGGGAGSLPGDLAALGVAFTLGLMFTLIRKLGLSYAWLHYAVASVLNAGLVALAFPLEAVEGGRLILLLALVFGFLPVAFLLISIGPRYITAPEVSLIMLLEAPFGAVFLWLVAARAPTVEAMAGGAILLVTLAAHTVYVARHPRPAAAPA